MKNKLRNIKGMTLIEVVTAIVIAGILAAVAFRSAVTITETGRTEITKTELEEIGFAIAGNPDLENNGVRTDFGYVGDVGALPPNLDALMNNPGGYSTWNGPYLKNRFGQIATDYNTDAWGVPYTYSGIDISSTGSGTMIVHKVGEAPSDFLYNRITGNIFDNDGTPPGDTYKDSISIFLTFPNGSGAIMTRGVTPDFGGYFTFDSIPIGNHNINLVFNPTSDTLKRFVSVLPNSSSYNEYIFPSSFGSPPVGGSGGGIVLVAGTEQVTGASCNDLRFDIENTSSTAVTITSITPSWSSPESYFKELIIGGTLVFDSANPRSGSGQTINIAGVIINAGQILTIQVEEFKRNSTGGPNVNMGNVDITVTFSDGSVISFNTGAC